MSEAVTARNIPAILEPKARLALVQVTLELRGRAYNVDWKAEGPRAIRFFRCGQPEKCKWFQLHLGAACLSSGLLWGGFKDLGAVHHAELRLALFHRDFDKAHSMKVGSDPMYCELPE